MITSEQLAQTKFDRVTSRVIQGHGYGSTEAGVKVGNPYLDAAHSAIIKAIDDMEALETKEARTKLRNMPSGFLGIDRQILSMITIHSVIDAEKSQATREKTHWKIGDLAETEAYALFIEKHDEEFRKDHREVKDNFEKTHRNIRDKNYTLKRRDKALRKVYGDLDGKWEPWTQPEKAHVGNFLLEATLYIGLFTRREETVVQQVKSVVNGKTITKTMGVPKQFVELSEDALENLAEIERIILKHLTVHLPLTEPPVPWTRARQRIAGSSYAPMVASRFWDSDRKIQDAINKGTMDEAIAALNVSQAVPWKINTFILDVIRKCYEAGIQIKKMPPKDDLLVPDTSMLPKVAWDKLTKDQQRVKGHAKNIERLNRKYRSQRADLQSDLALADQLYSTGRFWTPMYFDYRSRVYSLPQFSYQKSKLVRSLFLLANGEVLDDTGMYWLKVHVANCAGHDKVSFDDRVKWFEDHKSEIIRFAMAPMANTEWSKMDEPMLFLAGCKAYLDVTFKLPCYLPVAFDGSCNGLQHLCALTLDNAGALVNLTPGDKPSDLYAAIATKVREAIERDLKKNPLDHIANLCLAYGIDRKVVKRATMTLSYGSKPGSCGDEDNGPSGMCEQFMDDLMKPLDVEVLEGKRDEHPFGGYGTWLKASLYLAKKTYAACVELLNRPVEAMEFIQRLSLSCANDGLPMAYSTPNGFWVNIECPQMKKKLLSMHNKDGRYQPTVQEAIDGSIDKYRTKNASAPGFVHSMDACHLQQTVLGCHKEGIELALVHDSFACLPSKAGRMRQILAEEFHKLHSTDVLGNLKDQIEKHLGHTAHYVSKGKPPAEIKVPQKGNLVLDTVLHSPYMFS